MTVTNTASMEPIPGGIGNQALLAVAARYRLLASMEPIPGGIGNDEHLEKAGVWIPTRFKGAYPRRDRKRQSRGVTIWPSTHASMEPIPRGIGNQFGVVGKAKR